MDKIYQPVVLEQVNNIILGLQDANFFTDHEIEDLGFAKNYLADILTEKFIVGELDGNVESFFSDEEFDKILREIVVGTILLELKEKGYVNSYEDDNTDEVFFLTEDGKKYMKKLDDLI